MQQLISAKKPMPVPRRLPGPRRLVSASLRGRAIILDGTHDEEAPDLRWLEL